MPAPLPTPTRLRTGFLLALALAYAGGVVAYLPLLSLLLPVKVGAVAGEARLGVLTASVIAGALAASGSNILFGWLSDRSLMRGQGRRRWLAAGVVMTAASYGGIAGAASPVAVVAAVAVFQIAVNALLAPLLALMADEVPDAQKGLLGGLLALGAPAASALGALLVGLPVQETVRLLLVPLASAACIAPLLAKRAMPVAPVAIFRAAPVARGDLAAAWGARLLVQVAGNVLSLYLIYYFESVAPDLPPRELAMGVGRLLTVAYLLPLPVALLAGRLSDLTGARRSFLFAAAATAALGLVGLAAAANWAAGAAAFALYTIGSAVFLALHAAFAMQWLPDPRHRGRDLGLLNLTNTLPALAGPFLTWALATPRDFTAVMLVLAALTLGGGIVMLAVRGRS